MLNASSCAAYTHQYCIMLKYFAEFEMLLLSKIKALNVSYPSLLHTCLEVV